MSAPFSADLDTRGGTATATPGGTSTGSNLVHYDLDTVNGIFTVTWDDIGCFSSHTDKLNAFQLSLIDRSGDFGPGDFDIVFRCEASRNRYLGRPWCENHRENGLLEKG